MLGCHDATLEGYRRPMAMGNVHAHRTCRRRRDASLNQMATQAVLERALARAEKKQDPMAAAEAANVVAGMQATLQVGTDP